MLSNLVSENWLHASFTTTKSELFGIDGLKTYNWQQKNLYFKIFQVLLQQLSWWYRGQNQAYGPRSRLQRIGKGCKHKHYSGLGPFCQNCGCSYQFYWELSWFCSAWWFNHYKYVEDLPAPFKGVCNDAFNICRDTGNTELQWWCYPLWPES